MTIVQVDRALCCGNGMCVSLAPKIFAIDEAEGFSTVLVETVGPDDLPVVEQAVDFCPTGAVELVGDAS